MVAVFGVIALFPAAAELALAGVTVLLVLGVAGQLFAGRSAR